MLTLQSEGTCPLDDVDPVTLLKGSLEIDPLEVLSKYSTDFVNAELRMLQGLFSGEGIDHHMEPTCE